MFVSILFLDKTSCQTSMELVTMIITLSMIFVTSAFFITRNDWKILMTVVPIVFLIPFALQLDQDQTITYANNTLGCGQTSNTTFNCQYFAGTSTINLDPHLMTVLNVLIFMCLLLVIGYVSANCFELAQPPRRR